MGEESNLGAVGILDQDMGEVACMDLQSGKGRSKSHRQVPAQRIRRPVPRLESRIPPRRRYPNA